MTLKLFNWLLSIIIYIISFFINMLVSLIPNASMPNLTSATDVLNTFWEHIFQFFGWACDALMLDSFCISLIVDILVLRYIAKPTITLIKIGINWIWGAKDN